METAETAIAVLKVQVESIIRDAEKREKLHDARHAEAMSKLEQLSAAVASGHSFNSGVTTTIKAGWAFAGALPAIAFTWFINRGP
jgi:hypothetical protein